MFFFIQSLGKDNKMGCLTRIKREMAETEEEEEVEVGEEMAEVEEEQV